MQRTDYTLYSFIILRLACSKLFLSTLQHKQLQLGDKMDLRSYLLKPVQRISKYSLLLQDLRAECGAGRPRETAEVKAALEVVHFQLHHGNNLLAMDAIHHCDVSQAGSLCYLKP